MPQVMHTTAEMIYTKKHSFNRQRKELQKSILQHLEKDAREMYLNYIYPARGLNIDSSFIVKQYSTIIQSMDDLYNAAGYAV